MDEDQEDDEGQGMQENIEVQSESDYATDSDSDAAFVHTTALIPNSSIPFATLGHELHTSVILAIQPKFMGMIVNQIKNHDFRKYRLHSEVTKIWFYQITPILAITHLAITQGFKTSGEVCDSTGLGNDEFDQG